MFRKASTGVLLSALLLSLMAIAPTKGPRAFDRFAVSADSLKQEEGGSFVYTITNSFGPNTIAAYSRDRETGRLTFIDAFPTGGRGTGFLVESQSAIVADADRKYLFAVNPASNDISVMAIREDGSLEQVGSPVSSRGVRPASLALYGDLLYVANKGDGSTPPNYVGFKITDAGELINIKRTITLNRGDDPTHVLFNNSGSVVIGLRFGGRVVDSFRVKRSGRLRRVATLDNQRGPFAAAFNPTNEEQLIVADARIPGAASYRVFNWGELSPINSVSNSPERSACWIAIHNNGRLAWLANTGTNSLSLYTINGNGSVSLVGHHNTAAFGLLPFEIVLDNDNRFLYELNGGGSNRNIHVLQVTGGTLKAGLEDVAPELLPPGSSPMGLVIVEL